MKTVAMRVGEILVDPDTDAPIVVLHGVDEPKIYLPIFIGGMEATAIATAMAGVELPRPLTHDLLVSIVNELGTYVRKVTITDLIDGTFYAEITLVDDQGNRVEVDARPSDSIAVALRTGATIYASESVLAEAAGMLDVDEEPEATGTTTNAPAEAPKKPGPTAVVGQDIRLEDLDPDTFGKYKM
jgi:hypothetical protein